MPTQRLKLALTSCAIVLLLDLLVLTAGHMHGPRVVLGALAQVDLQPTLGADDHHQDPSGNNGHDDCALCWAQAGAGRALTPPPTALPLRRVSFAEPLSAAYKAAHQITLCAFRSRAPPLSIA
jgi:hypothetical protein